MKKAALWVTGVVFLGKVLFAMANNAQGVLLTSYIDAFGLTSSAQGLPNAAANAGVLLAMILSVSMAARIGKPKLYALGLGLMAVMLAVTGAAQSALWLIAAYFVMGFGFGSIDTTASAIVADLHQGKRASMMMGVLHAVYGTGGILAPILMTAALSAGATWRAVLWVLAGVSAAAFVLCTVVFSREKERLAVHTATPGRLTLTDMRLFVRQKGNLLIVLCVGCYCAHQCSVYLWITRIIGVGYGNEALGAAALSLFWVGTVASRLLVPLTGITTVRYLRYGMLAAAVLLGAGAAIGGAVVVCIAAALSGLAGGAVIPMSLSEISRRNPERSMLSITAVLLTTAVAAIICAPLIGFVVGKTALIAGLVVSAVFALCSAVSAFGIREL